MLKKLMLLLIITLMFPSFALADSSKDAVRALKKLQVRCETGISYRDYAPALGDAKFEVSLFLDSKEAAQNPELAKVVDRIMNHYQYALSIWNEKFEGGNFIYTHSSTAKSLLYKYPDASSIIKDDLFSKIIYIDSAVYFIWSKASEDMTNAMSLLSRNDEPK